MAFLSIALIMSLGTPAAGFFFAPDYFLVFALLLGTLLCWFSSGLFFNVGLALFRGELDETFARAMKLVPFVLGLGTLLSWITWRIIPRPVDDFRSMESRRGFHDASI